MSDHKPPKKSESLEVRLPHPTKLAFMSKARSEGRVPSEVVRQQIDDYLSDAGQPASTPPRWLLSGRVRNYLAALLAALALAGSIATVIGLTSPAAAQSQLADAFEALDSNGDGVISRDEFVSPAKAHELNLLGAESGPGDKVGIGGAGSAAYVRFVLSARNGDVPLLIGVDHPEPDTRQDQIPRLVGAAFDRLDADGNGKLTMSEFLGH